MSDGAEILDQSGKNLQQSGYRELRNVLVSLEGDEVTLKGNVSTYHLKQMAQETLKINGYRINNLIQVLQKNTEIY